MPSDVDESGALQDVEGRMGPKYGVAMWAVFMLLSFAAGFAVAWVIFA